MASPPVDCLEHARDALSGRPASVILEEIAAEIEKSRTLWITAHANPDGDALGSAVALGLAATAMGKQVQVLFDSPLPEKLVGLVPGGSFRRVHDTKILLQGAQIDLFVLLDTSEPERAGGIGNVGLSRARRSVCLDHHVQTASREFHHHLVVTQAPSTGSLVLALIGRLGVPLNREIAEALWTAVSSDTGWFRFENTGAWALRDAARLCETGINIPRIYRQLYEDVPVARMRILGTVLAGLRTEFDGAFLYGITRSSDVLADGLSLADLDGVVDHLKSVRGSKVIAFIVETGPNAFKVSLRAQGGHEVESLARKLGGGGHAKAAGGRFSGTLAQLLDLLRAEIAEKLKGLLER